MQASSFAYGIGERGTRIYELYSNSSLSSNSSVGAFPAIVDADLDVDEALFLSLSVLLLYCYVGLLRLRTAPPNRARSPSRGIGLVDGASRKSLKRSGLTTELIEARLKSFTVDSGPPKTGKEEQVSARNCKDYCEISFGQEACAICLELYSGKKLCKVRALPCDHIFHLECIDEWLLRCNQCPCCLERAC